MLESISLTDLLEDISFDNVFNDVLINLKKNPDDTSLREFLFKIYCVDGLWDKALLQLETIDLLDNSLKSRTELYKNLVFSEILREKVLSGKSEAGTLVTQHPEWINILHQANCYLDSENIEGSEKLCIHAFELAPESSGSGSIIGDFSWISDSDTRIGPVCEFISAGGYRWVPFTEIQSFEIPKPKNLLDLIWAPAHLKIKNDIYYGFMPARYPLLNDSDKKFKLGLKTEWKKVSDNLSIANGRKTLITDHGDFALFDLDQVTLFNRGF